jgi:hypothetical protein
MPTGLFNLKQQLQGLIRGAWLNQKTNYVEYLVVAGGGGGGGSYTGGIGPGGGAGGLLQGIVPITTGSAITVTVGGGGTGGSASSSSAQTNGLNSIFGSISAIGGGYGAANFAPNSGGSGGGGSQTSSSTSVGASGVIGQGNSGGNATTTANYGGGGGGGAGTKGLDGSTTISGNGGAGIASSISGAVVTYAGGGGGSGFTSLTAGVGGVGGGGAGALGTAGTSGTANTGGGGGGAGYSGSHYAGGSGGSGIVIISYPDTYSAPASFGGANSPTASTSGSGSLNFNGSSQYIATADTSNIGSGSFTLEGWLYCSGGTGPALFDTFNGASTNSYQLYLSSNHLVFYDGSGAVITGTASLSTNTWYHFAAVRSGTTLKTYINGVQDGSVTNSTNYNATGVLWIGSQRASGPTDYWNGYLSNLRIVVGTAVYTANFTPPTAPLTAISGTQYLMSAVSGSPLADSSGNNYNPTNTTTPTWNQSSPFATGLGYKNRVYTWTGSGTVTF